MMISASASATLWSDSAAPMRGIHFELPSPVTPPMCMNEVMMPVTKPSMPANSVSRPSVI